MYGELGLVLRDAREEYGITQKKISELAGVDQSNISRLEAGRLTDAPRNLREIIAAYSRATSIAEAELLSRWGAEVARESRRRRHPRGR